MDFHSLISGPREIQSILIPLLHIFPTLHNLTVLPKVEDSAAYYRLPSNILPSSYKITLKPYLIAEDSAKQFTFEGETFINIKTREPNQKAIVLHSKYLNYSLYELFEEHKPNNKIKIESFSINSISDKLILKLSTALKAGTSYTLHFVYTGFLKANLKGFYRSFYTDKNRNTRWVGVTQFQPTYARRAFPCFDEPKFKATFNLSLIRHKSLNSVSNTPIISTVKVDENYQKDAFDTTPIMSTYLLAFIVSDFVQRGANKFFVTTQPDFIEKSKFALDAGSKLLTAIGKYFQMPYNKLGIEKMHMAAIPQLDAIAMENWGLETYWEIKFVSDENSSERVKQELVRFFSHEHSHQWFGNLVTCDWWGYTWLNEGFASYFEYHMPALVYPEWNLEESFVLDLMYIAFVIDTGDYVDPLSVGNVNSPSEVNDMFSAITYAKGGSVIRMIRHAIGEANFQKSLRSYLKEFQYKTVVPKNIFKHWKADWPANSVAYADGVFTSFTEQVGYPMVYIDLASDSKSMTIKQKRFLIDRDSGSNASLLYTIPLSYTTNLDNNFNNTAPKLYLEAKAEKVTVSFPKAVEWVVGNIQSTGYYRVNYSRPLWHKIRHALHAANWSGIHELNRAQYVNDLLALAQAGEIPYKMYLHFLDYLQTELSYFPWSAAFNGFEFLAAHLGVENENFGKYIIHLARKAYDKLGFEETENDTSMQILTRAKIISWVCKYAHEDCIKKSLNLVRNSKTTAVPVNIRGPVYCTAIRDGTEDDFNILYDKMRIETSPAEQSLIIKSLGCVRERKLVERYFNIIVSDEVRSKDKFVALIALISENAENVSPVFELFTKNIEVLHQTMDSLSLQKVIVTLASYFTTGEQQDKLQKFIESEGSNSGQLRDYWLIASRIVKENLAWAVKNLRPIKTYLKDFIKNASL